MKHHSLSKVLKRLACVLAALVIALAVAVFALWHNELATLSSLKKLSDRDEAHRDGAVYQLNVSGGYYFDDFLAQGGASTDSELISFITQSITKGIIPMNIKTSTIACSAFTADTQSGDRVFGRNYDFSATNTAIVYTNPGKGRHASYSTIDLSFLGLGVAAPMPSLGSLAPDAVMGMNTYPVLLIAPALMISIMILVFNLFGDGLRDAFDPKLKS